MVTTTGEYSGAIEIEKEKRGRSIGVPQKGSLRRDRLFRAVEHSYRNLDPFRNLNRSLVQEYAGPAYGESEGREKYLNKLNQAIDAYMMLLAANRPAVLISTHYRDLRAFSQQFQVAMNNLFREIGLEHTIRRWVMDAFFCMGAVKVHMADSAEVQFENDLWLDPGTPGASNVSLDHWVHDISANKVSEMKFSGDLYRIPYADLEAGIEMGMYEKAASEELLPSTKIGGEDSWLAQISRGYETDIDEFEPMVDLADIWIPREGRIYTYAVSDRTKFSMKGAPIAVMDWDGPEHGPYHLLGFSDVPDNIMPTSPASHLAALDRLINNLMRKQAQQAKRQKDNPVYTPAGAESARKLRDGDDGQWVEVNDPKDVAIIKQGGADPGNQALLTGTLQMFDEMAGNLTAMLGLGAQSDTVGQEQLIHNAGNRKIGQMQNKVLDATTALAKSLGFLLWEDEFKEIPGEIQIDGAEGYSADATWTPDDREGNFLDYNFEVNVFSMAYQSPGQRVEMINQLLTQIYQPMIQQFTEQGGVIDISSLTDIYAELLNLPRLKDVITFQDKFSNDLEQGQQGRPQTSTKSPVSTRNYVRRSVPSGGTPQNQTQQMMQSLNQLAGNGQKSGTIQGA